jgi:hypothetical protein
MGSQVLKVGGVIFVLLTCLLRFFVYPPCFLWGLFWVVFCVWVVVWGFSAAEFGWVRRGSAGKGGLMLMHLRLVVWGYENLCGDFLSSGWRFHLHILNET